MFPIQARAGDEYSTSAPAEARILGRAKSCGVVNDANEGFVQKIAAAIIRLGATPAAAIAEAIQYVIASDNTFFGWASAPLMDVPAPEPKQRNYRAVRDAEYHNAIVRRTQAIKAEMEAQ